MLFCYFIILFVLFVAVSQSENQETTLFLLFLLYFEIGYDRFTLIVSVSRSRNIIPFR